MDREMLDNLLKSKFGEDFDTSSITDDDINGLFPDDNNDEEDKDDNTDENIDDTNLDDDSHDNDEDEEDNDVDLSQINVDELSEDAKLLYSLIIKEKKARISDRIDTMISSAELSDTQKKVVKRFAKASDSIDDIKDMISELEKDNKANKRTIGNTRIIGRNNIKSTVKNKQSKEPTFGTKEFGAWLAKKK